MKDLLEPITFRNGTRARNRVAVAAMTNQQSHADGTLSEQELRWLQMRAEGGFGIVTTCATHVSQEGQGWPGELGIWNDGHIEGHAKIASAMHAAGAIALVQLFHGGARADVSASGLPAWSAVASEAPSSGAIRAGSEEDITRVIAAFADAAARAERAGIDGAELHGAHGYLLSQFLSAHNTRTDGWGGDLKGRARLLRETTRAVRARVSDRFVLGVRLSPEDWGQAVGQDLDENLQVAQWLAEDGADFIHLSLWEAQNNTKKRPEAHPVSLFRAALADDIRIFVAGKIWTAEEAKHQLDLGADVVALGRAAITNPDWPHRVAEQRTEPKRPPLTAAELSERGLSDTFIEYMRRWKGFVAPLAR